MLKDVLIKGGWVIIEDVEALFPTSIGKTVAGDDRCAEVAVKHSCHHSRLYFLDAVK